MDRTPVIPSHEFAGVVAAVGEDVADLAVGDEVFGLVPFDRDGAAAEYVVVPADRVARKPTAVPDVLAAAAVLPALTAWEALNDQAELKPGDRLLVRGGNGAVGAFVVQFARVMGVRVTAVISSEVGRSRVEALGAEMVIVAGAEDATEHTEFDVAIDAVGAGTPEWLFAMVRRGGRTRQSSAEEGEKSGVEGGGMGEVEAVRGASGPGPVCCPGWLRR